MTEISNDCCRFCLRNCSEFDLDYDDGHVQLYFISTGYTVSLHNTPKKICQLCNNFFTEFKIFRDRANQVEEQLISSQHIKSELSFLDDEPCDEPYHDSYFSEPEDFPYKEIVTPKIEIFDNKKLPRTRKKDNKRKVKKTEAEKKQFTCQLCPEKKFPYEATLRKHNEEVHKIKLSKHCAECRRDFTKHSGLKEHLQRIHGKKDRICHLCGKAFSVDQALRFHIKTTHPDTLDSKTYICDFCNKSFVGRSNIVIHLKQWHKLRECNFCNKRYYSYHSLLLHRQAVHEPSKQFYCGSCSKSFSTKKYLAQHQKVHSEFGYACPVCPDQKFSFTTTLRSHISSKHKEIKLPPKGTTLRNYKWI